MLLFQFLQFIRFSYFFRLTIYHSVPRTPLDESVVGFQVDQLIDAIQGEARIKITVYEHGEGQVSCGREVYLSTCHAKDSSLKSFIRSI